MSEILKVLNKKVELKSEKVELKTIKEVEQDFRKLLSNDGKVSTLLSSATKEINKQIKEMSSFINGDLGKISNQLKELGIKDSKIDNLYKVGKEHIDILKKQEAKVLQAL